MLLFIIGNISQIVKKKLNKIAKTSKNFSSADKCLLYVDIWAEFRYNSI